ncbi:adenosine deaminase [Clostridium botulinum]|uniref:Adenosine deaminase n=1 Tax=Clostridium botulinum TaxID=1491 RepID=A0AA43Y5F8_CLOBO|nr:adenosine deaminase [Clostridium botulinum]NFI07336.1 adenosine deaminase [Clostridium botulinum]NFI20342.1 adenosine deaminase [Clostridium botulinum]NFQ77077.1 adenosine deaminase [Clostridium botulinum]NFS06645.1 adenosine deaminase [Clostridium botulinum]
MNFKKLPKIELHCHLDGSLRVDTILDIAKKDNIPLPSYNKKELINYVSIMDDCNSLDEYLNKFFIPNKVMQTKENLKRIAFELLEDVATDNVKYIEVRFAPLLHVEKGLNIEEIIESVLEGIKEAEKLYDIKGNLILGCMRNMDIPSAFEVVKKGSKFIGKGVVAIDLCAGEEPHFPGKYIEVLKLAKECGYRITIHAGEAGVGENVLEAITLLNAERIGHGIYIKNCAEAYKLVKEKNIPLEVCPTSNLHTKAFESYETHPFMDFLKDGIKVTINTDNMTVSNTTITKELEMLNKFCGLSIEDYKILYLNAVEASFASPETKEMLKSYVKEITA